jgi:hypothetical protein
MSVEVDVNAPAAEAEAAAEGESAGEEVAPEMLEGDAAAQVALAIVALQDALPVECASIEVMGLDADGDVLIECTDAAGNAAAFAVPMDAMNAAVETMASSAEGDA